MRIAVDARTMGYRPSGIGIYLYDFLCELVKKKDFQITLLTDVAESPQIQTLIESGIRVRCFGKRVFRSLGVYPYFSFVREYLCKEQPDLFWEPNNLLPVKLNGFKGKTVLTVHDLFPITKPEYFHWSYRIYFRLGIMRSLNFADAVLFNSMETKNQTMSTFPKAGEKSTLVSYLIVKKPPVREVKDDGFFLYIGNLERRKGTDLLLAAYRRYCQMNGGRALYLGGSIREKEIEVQLAECQKECSGLRYLGYLQEAEKYDYLASCRCFLFPSKAEGFGLPPLEAMGYGKRVLTSDLGIFREILGNQNVTFSLRVPKEEQIEELSRLMLKEDRIFGRNRDGNLDKAFTMKSEKQRLERYNEETLGELLAGFLKGVAGDKNESRV